MAHGVNDGQKYRMESAAGGPFSGQMINRKPVPGIRGDGMHCITTSPKRGALQRPGCGACSFRLADLSDSFFDDTESFSALPCMVQERTLHRTGFIPELLWIHLCRMACRRSFSRVFFRGLSPVGLLCSSTLIIY